MPWLWVQSTGEMFAPDGTLEGKGYSGVPGHVNDPAAQDTPNVGPIPVWKYKINPPVDSAKTGPFSLPLTPDPSPLPDGRSAFLIHGDSVLHPGCASEGCIILAYAYRVQIWHSNDKELQVTRERPAPIT